MSGSQSFVLLFVFSPEACPYCLDEVWAINRIQRELADRVSVRGIALCENDGDLAAFRKRWSAEFPIEVDQSQRWQALSLGRSPFKVVVDAEGHIVYSAGPFPDAESHEGTLAHLRSICGVTHAKAGDGRTTE